MAAENGRDVGVETQVGLLLVNGPWSSSARGRSSEGRGGLEVEGGGGGGDGRGERG